MAETAIVLPGQVTETSLRLPLDLSFDEWADIGRDLGRMHSAVLWWLGDWWNYGVARHYGDMASPEARERVKALTGRAYDTLVVCGWVAARFEYLRRRRNLEWSHHREVSALPPAIADRWLDLAEEKHWSKQELRRQIKRGLPDENGEPLILPPSMDLRPGDFRTALAKEEPKSVDWIITDPPYPREYVPLYGDLAEMAARLLKPGGSLLCMTGQSYLPEVLALMTPHLSYNWTLAYLTPGGQAVQAWEARANAFWKPVLWFVRGTYDGCWVGDVTRSAVNDNDKEYHDWGQSSSGMTDLVGRFVRPGDLIVDPFLGGGTTALVAAELGCRFIGCDSDAAALDGARRRLGLPAAAGAEDV